MLGCVCLIMLLSISFIGAVKPTQVINSGCEIRTPTASYLQIGRDVVSHVHVLNISTGSHNSLTNDTTDCYLHLYNETGNHLIKQFYGWDGFEWEIMIDGGNFSNAGDYAFYIQCNSTDLICGVSGGITVTESGVEITEGRSILVIGLMGILFMFMFASLFVLLSVENYMAKFISYWISHILIVIITFVGWQIGVEGLLGGMALTGIFRILFWIFIIAVIPMIFVSFAWVVYIHAFNEHFQKLIDKGEDPETAFAIAKKKKGWMFGN